MRTEGGLAYRESGLEGHPAALVHGYPESSYMWRGAISALADAGWHAIAPDLAGFGDSEPDPPGTWERHVEAIDRFRRELGIKRCVLVARDWGGLIGLRWACEHSDAVRAPGTGEEVGAAIDRAAFGGLLRSVSPSMGDDAIDESWKAFADETRRRGQLELYRSGDFEQLSEYRLADLGGPALILWASRTSSRRWRAPTGSSESCRPPSRW